MQRQTQSQLLLNSWIWCAGLHLSLEKTWNLGPESLLELCRQERDALLKVLFPWFYLARQKIPCLNKGTSRFIKKNATFPTYHFFSGKSNEINQERNFYIAFLLLTCWVELPIPTRKEIEESVTVLTNYRLVTDDHAAHPRFFTWVP